MRREASIPLFLWVATAALAHLLWSGGAEQGARLIDERLDVGRFAASIRSHVKNSVAPPIEIAIQDEAAPEETPPEEAPPDSVKDDSTDPKDEAPPELAKPKPEEKKPEPKQAEEKKPEPEAKKPEEKKAEAQKPAEKAEPPKELPKPIIQQRIAVNQNVEDEKQKDNPDAKYIADKANTVAEETRARITSTDQNDKQPTPGSSPGGPPDDPGNAQETHVRQDSNQPGLKNIAPGGSQSSSAERPTAATPAQQTGKASAAAPGAAGASAAKAAVAAAPSVDDKNQTTKAATPERLGSPEVVASESGAFSLKGPEAATPAQLAQRAKKRLPPRRPHSLMEALGLGSAGLTPNGVALNLTPHLAAEAIGTTELSRMKRADGERRRTEHRGSWKIASFEHFKSSIENYVPAVKPGNQTALNTARVPFASYLTQIHNRIHPIFSDQFIDSLDNLPASDPMNNQSLITSLEIVVDREEGRLVRQGVVRTSGLTRFDVSALSAVERAAPFGTPPAEIVSPDGNVYLHWDFRRDEMRCSTLYAYPYILKAQPQPAPLPTTPPQPPFRGPDDEAAPSGERHGFLAPPPTKRAAAPQGS
jgi:hypothetical protein